MHAATAGRGLIARLQRHEATGGPQEALGWWRQQVVIGGTESPPPAIRPAVAACILRQRWRRRANGMPFAIWIVMIDQVFDRWAFRTSPYLWSY